MITVKIIAKTNFEAQKIVERMFNNETMKCYELDRMSLEPDKDNGFKVLTMELHELSNLEQTKKT